MRKLRERLADFIIGIISPGKIATSIDRYRISTCAEQVILGLESQFYPEATVENLSNDRTKIEIGKGTHIRGNLLIWPYSKGIKIGDNCFIGKRSEIWSGEFISIGNNVLISHNVTIIDSDSHEIDKDQRARSFQQMIKAGHPSSKGDVKTQEIIIEDDVWISYNVAILKGVTIGKGAIVGAGSVVTKDVPDFAFVAGNPAAVIKTK